MQLPKDYLQLYGRLQVRIYDVKSGRKDLKLRFTKMNQIVNGGRDMVLEMLAQIAGDPGAQGNPFWNNVWSLSAGEDPTPAMVTQTQLGSPVWTGQLTPATERAYNPALYELNVLKEFPAGTGTGAILTEAGIFVRGQFDDPTAAGVATWEAIPGRRMYARQTHPAVTKGATMAIVYDWHLGMTVQSSP